MNDQYNKNVIFFIDSGRDGLMEDIHDMYAVSFHP